MCCRSQVCGRSSDSGERQPRRWQNLLVLQRERYGWRACWEGHACSHRTALQSTHMHINTQPHIRSNTRSHKLALTKDNSDTHKRRDTHTLTQTLMWKSFCICKKHLTGVWVAFIMAGSRGCYLWLFLAWRRVSFVVCGTIAPEDRNLREMLNVTRTWEAKMLSMAALLS